MEILIVDDGFTDDTPRIADDYARRYPGVVRTLHKENSGTALYRRYRKLADAKRHVIFCRRLAEYRYGQI